MNENESVTILRKTITQYKGSQKINNDCLYVVQFKYLIQTTKKWRRRVRFWCGSRTFNSQEYSNSYSWNKSFTYEFNKLFINIRNWPHKNLPSKLGRQTRHMKQGNGRGFGFNGCPRCAPESRNLAKSISKINIFYL